MANPVTQNDDAWLEKLRLLLAAMALHLLQTSFNPKEIKLDRLRDNLHAILTIADLKKATDKLNQK
ncbi:hypothetical protein [Maribacter sp. HTCC2170]|uniref:hypothetical protein n=1 Tax=Maribacter sp. (strain HTCC2170 / KCCM 42371) TaxID=313603 RepID=UPI00006B2188|nr:hypothetical protein [Maribacter sp. HTCC2170]EAR00066.1 hypothetical protein FB2170_00330 [Maribacter sp. HTCC2170]